MLGCLVSSSYGVIALKRSPKLVVEAGYFDTKEEALKMGKKIKKVVFTNTTRDLSFKMTRSAFYVFTDARGNRYHMMDYFVWLGQLSNVLGDWEVVIKAKKCKFAGAFSITRDMVDAPSPVPVDVLEVKSLGNGFDEVVFTDTGAEQYKVRGILSTVYDGVNHDEFLFDVVNPPCTDGVCTAEVPHYDGLSCRVESRYFEDWITLGGAWGKPCNDDFTTPHTGRSITWFRLPDLP